MGTDPEHNWEAVTIRRKNSRTRLQVLECNPDAVARAIDAEFHAGPVATTTRTKGMFQADTLSELAELIGFIHWLGYACVGLVLSLVATTIAMSVQDRNAYSPSAL